MSTVLSPFLNVPKINRGIEQNFCGLEKKKDTFRSKSARRIESELLADAYTNIIADRVRSGANFRKSSEISARHSQNYLSNLDYPLRTVTRTIDDSSFFNRSDAIQDLRALERKACHCFDNHRLVGSSRYSADIRPRRPLYTVY